MDNDIADEILQRALQQLEEANLSGRVRGALDPVTGKTPPNPNQLIAQGYADQARDGINAAAPAIQETFQEAVKPAEELRAAAAPQLLDPYYKYQK